MAVEITDVRIYRVLGSDRLKAYANVTLGGEFAIHGIKIMEGENGLWVGMPRQKSQADETWRDIFHPITKESREKLINIVLEAYQGYIDGEEQEKQDEKKST